MFKTGLVGETLRTLQSKNVEDLRTYAVIIGEESTLDTLAVHLVVDPESSMYTETFYQAPPMDIPPETPDFPRSIGPSGSIGFDFLRRRMVEWSRIRIVNIEYSFDPFMKTFKMFGDSSMGWDQDSGIIMVTQCWGS